MFDKIEKKNLGLFFMNTILVFLVFGTFVFNKHYSSDDFFCYYDQLGEANGVIFSSYRIVLGVLYTALAYLKLNVVKYQIVFGIFMLLCFSYSITLITLTVKDIMLKSGRDIKGILPLGALNIGSLMLVINVFVSEWIWFSLGYVQWGLSVLFAVLGAVYFIKGNTKSYILSFVYLFISAGCYQISISIYVFLVLLFILCEEKGKISIATVKNTIKAAIPAIFSIILNMIVTKVLVALGYGYSGERMNINLKSILNKCNMLWQNEIRIWKDGMGLLPSYFLWIIGILYVVLIIYSIMRCNEARWNFLAIVIMIFAGTGVMCIPTLLQDIFYQPARMVVPLACIFLVLHISCVFMNDKCILLSCITILGAIYLGINFVEIQKNAADSIKTCAIEEKEVNDILRYIQHYEEENNCVIDTIALGSDEYPTYKYYNEINGSEYWGEMATRSILVDWANIQLLNFYSGQKFDKIISGEIKDKFRQNNYDYFSIEEQIYIEDNVAYIYIY